jgi:hypothetical protein
MKVSLRIVWVLGLILFRPAAAHAQATLSGDWELSSIAGNSRFGAAYAPIKEQTQAGAPRTRPRCGHRNVGPRSCQATSTPGP